MNRNSRFQIPKNAGDFRLMDRKVVDEVKKYREHDRYLRGIVASVGFKQVAVPFDRDERLHGETHYPLNTMIRLAMDGILGFSTFPLTIISRLGFVTALISVLWTTVASMATAPLLAWLAQSGFSLFHPG